MIELPAAKIIKGSAQELTIAIPEWVRDIWVALARTDAVAKSRQLYVKIGKPRRPRTTGERSQNHHLNGHVQQIAMYTKDHFDDVKMHIKREAIADGYPIYTDSFGHAHPKSEADASTVECAMLIEAAHRVADFLDVRLNEYDEED